MPVIYSGSVESEGSEVSGAPPVFEVSIGAPCEALSGTEPPVVVELETLAAIVVNVWHVLSKKLLSKVEEVVEEDDNKEWCPKNLSDK